MTKSLHRVVYKPDSQSTDEFMVIVDEAEFKRWQEDKSVPISLVVESFSVFHSGQGNQGKLGQASKQQLETIFDTSNENDVVEQILKKGELKSADAFRKELSGIAGNPTRGGGFVDTRGSGGSLRG